MADQTVTTGTVFDLPLDISIFFDPDNNTLRFTAEQSDGRSLANTLSFDGLTGHLSGVVEAATTLGINVTAHDPRELTATAGFILNVLPAPSG